MIVESVRLGCRDYGLGSRERGVCSLSGDSMEDLKDSLSGEEMVLLFSKVDEGSCSPALYSCKHKTVPWSIGC